MCVFSWTCKFRISKCFQFSISAISSVYCDGKVPLNQKPIDLIPMHLVSTRTKNLKIRTTHHIVQCPYIDPLRIVFLNTLRLTIAQRKTRHHADVVVRHNVSMGDNSAQGFSLRYLPQLVAHVATHKWVPKEPRILWCVVLFTWWWFGPISRNWEHIQYV